ncbi:1,4-dihydroxy-2-naphthoate polyprenyltransferase [Actinotignum schaalii]|uniref:1,4-dihydroxy-2-naphthoate octaprenyltransferase n=1 Tax=Actinotignum schaalii FB123-CNA-2 TaxID=883067 RepID=S2VP64_9ACTO|nr:1,4-dihydroxy-2-naphthoate polyprenyltransferase [Actinotignum schaalii]EPD28606.1 1,4-dihydroxy-2-naphthoate octaprenyltransferase [Actinotignum schaalii FB123-CNA-2]
MATVTDWLEGARVRTLPASVSPVIAGAGIALWEGTLYGPILALAFVLALLLQIGVNFANDYSDGIRGTDDHRTGPPRLTGGGTVRPGVVLAVALTCFALAALVGLIIIAWCGKWWLIGVGVAALLAAWFYTGGRHPYGYMGLGEVFVFIFFGLVATCGTVYIQGGTVPWQAWVAASAVGLIACAILMANNIRDIPTDAVTGKHTLAVRLGDTWARRLYVAMLAVAMGCGVVLAFTPSTHQASLLLYLPAFAIAFRNSWRMLSRGPSRAQGRALIPVLKTTGITELAFALAVLVSFWASSLLV